MKLVWTTLAGLYLSLTLIIASWILIFMDTPKWVSWSLLVLIIVLGLCNFALGIANIVAASKLYNNNEYYVLRVRMKLIKLASIPYFIVNFIFNFLFFMVLFGASRGLIILTPIPMLMIIPIALTYLSVLFTSTYGIGFILKLRKNRISTGRAIVHIILQVFFVLDIVDTIILIIKHKAKKPDLSFKKGSGARSVIITIGLIEQFRLLMFPIMIVFLKPPISPNVIEVQYEKLSD